jgi:hypothetical protein
MKESENMIDYISCDNGAIEMFADDVCVAVAETAKSIAYFLKEYGFDGSVYTSSSIDFASEYGFENDEDAIALWEEGVKYYEMTV